jgi:hypothetical protein
LNQLKQGELYMKKKSVKNKNALNSKSNRSKNNTESKKDENWTAIEEQLGVKNLHRRQLAVKLKRKT